MVPKLRFKGFSKNWSSNKLEHIFSFKNGLNASKEMYGQGIKFINVLDIINNDKINFDVIQDSVVATDEQISNYKVIQGDILFQRSSETREEVGQANVYTDSKIVLFGGFVIRARPVIKINSIFFNFQLKTDALRKDITQRSGGSTRYNIGQDSLGEVTAFLPEIDEQTKIADFLSSIDEKITLLNKQCNLLGQYKKGMMQKIFSQEVRFKDKNGNVYSEWKIKPFKELYKLLITNSLSRAELNYESGNIKNIHYGDIHTRFNSRFDITKELVPYISKTMKIAEECFCRKGDLVIADASEDYNDIGKSIEIININQLQIVAGLHTFLARPITKMALGFGSYMMQSSEVRRQIKIIATGSSVLSITKKNLLELMIPLPSLDEQTKIANFLSLLDDKITAKNAELEKLKAWKQGLLQQMFV